MNSLAEDEIAAILGKYAHTIRPAEVTPEEVESPKALARLSDHEPVDVSDRALKMEEVMRIAIAWKWPSAIPHFLQLKGVPYLSDLTDPQLDDLLGRMHGFVDAAETGCSLADNCPAL